MKNVVVVVGSPRKNGNTEILADAFIKGATDAGNHVERLCVAKMQIHSCIGCNFCYKDPEHKCCQHDDMDECYKILAKADAIVFATPIYFYNVSSQLKCFIDRLHNPIRNEFKVKKLGLLAVCADSKEFVFDSVKTMYTDILKYFSLENGGVITACSVAEKGDILGNSALLDAEKMGREI